MWLPEDKIPARKSCQPKVNKETLSVHLPQVSHVRHFLSISSKYLSTSVLITYLYIEDAKEICPNKSGDPLCASLLCLQIWLYEDKIPLEKAASQKETKRPSLCISHHVSHKSGIFCPFPQNTTVLIN
jgi:hypothetical protein